MRPRPWRRSACGQRRVARARSASATAARWTSGSSSGSRAASWGTAPPRRAAGEVSQIQARHGSSRRRAAARGRSAARRGPGRRGSSWKDGTSVAPSCWTSSTARRSAALWSAKPRRVLRDPAQPADRGVVEPAAVEEGRPGPALAPEPDELDRDGVGRVVADGPERRVELGEPVVGQRLTGRRVAPGARPSASRSYVGRPAAASWSARPRLLEPLGEPVADARRGLTGFAGCRHGHRLYGAVPRTGIPVL